MDFVEIDTIEELIDTVKSYINSFWYTFQAFHYHSLTRKTQCVYQEPPNNVIAYG